MPKKQCQICWFQYPSLPSRTCDLCKNKYHEICYFERRPKSEYNCQACALVILQEEKKVIKGEPACVVCGRSQGLMKDIGGGEVFGHVLCVISSGNFEIQSYRSFKVSQKKQAKKHKCWQCKKQSRHLLQCQNCTYKSHKSCLKSDEQDISYNLQGNLKTQHNLLHHLLSQNPTHTLTQDSEIFKLLQLTRPKWMDHRGQFKRIALCQGEGKRYCWCYCGDPGLNDQRKNPSIVCDGCNRYVHLSCTGMKDPKQIKSYFCPGCKSQQKYKKWIKLPDLLKQITSLQQKQLTIPDLRFIDSFPFIYSTKLIKNLKNYQPLILEYLAIKAIHQMVQEKNKEKEKEKEKDKDKSYLSFQNFYGIIGLITGEDIGKKSYQMLWKSYCEYIEDNDEESIAYVSTLKPLLLKKTQEIKSKPQIKVQVKIQPKVQIKIQPKAQPKLQPKIQIKEQIKSLLKTCQGLLQNNPSSQIKNVVKNIHNLRKKVRKSEETRKVIESQLQNNIFLALLVFKSSFINEEKIIEMLLNHFLCKKKVIASDIQEIRALKTAKCPNFETEPAWILIQGALKKRQQKINFSKGQLNEQRKFQTHSDQNQIQSALPKILQNKQVNLKLYNQLKKRKQSTQNFSQEKSKKLMVCYQWSLLSKKLFLGLEKSQMSIDAIVKAYNLMKILEYPEISFKSRIQALYKYCEPVLKITKRLSKSKLKLKQGSIGIDLTKFFNKPMRQDLDFAINLIRNPVYPEIWADLQRYELQDLIAQASEIASKFQALFKDTVIDVESSEIELKKKQPMKIIDLLSQIKDFPVNTVNIFEYFQITYEANIAEMKLKNSKWVAEKQLEIENQSELTQDLVSILKQMKESKRFEVADDFRFEEILSDLDAEKYFVEEFAKLGETKLAYFNKHVRRNKKWLRDLESLKNKVIKSISYEQICRLQFKMKTAIFSHQKIISQVLIPLKKQCEETSRKVAEIIPYCRVISPQFVPRENVFNPQNQTYKDVKNLIVKDYIIRLYQRDCNTLKNLVSIQQKLGSRTKQEKYQTMLSQFQQAYKSISIYLHQLKFVWQLLLQVSQKLFTLHKQSQNSFTKEIKAGYIKRHLKLLKITKKIAQFGGLAENIRKVEELQREIQEGSGSFLNFEIDSC